MITIKYSPEGEAIADHKAEEVVRSLVKLDNDTECAFVNVVVSTENVITIARI